MNKLFEMRYAIMVALYYPILLIAISAFDIEGQSIAVQGWTPDVIVPKTVVMGQTVPLEPVMRVDLGDGFSVSGEHGLTLQGDSVFLMGTGGVLAADEETKMISATIDFTYTQVDGTIKRVPVTRNIEVRRPEIVATSEATSTLYRLSSNTVRIDVPGLEDRTLRLAYGGRSVEGRTLSVSPSAAKVDIGVYLVDKAAGDELLLGHKSFTVIDPPRPEIKVLHAGRELRNGDVVPQGRAVLTFQFDADEDFRRRFPRDARYRAGEATVYLRRGLGRTEELGTFPLAEGTSLTLTRVLSRKAQPGDRVIVQLANVSRINHAGRAIPVPLSAGSLTFGFTLN